jgi:hypothetical protein
MTTGATTRTWIGTAGLVVGGVLALGCTPVVYQQPAAAAPTTGAAAPAATIPGPGLNPPPPPAGAAERALELESTESRAVKPAAAATPELRHAMGLYARRIAVTIGVDAYQPPLPPLRAAVSDAQRMAALFRAMGFDQVIGIADTEATRSGILALLEQRVASTAGPNDLVVVFFAGHGVTIGERGFILPQDATSEPEKTGISVQQLKESALRMKAKHVLYLTDACFSGSMFRRSATTENTNALAYWESAGRNRIVQIMTAGNPNETVLEAGGWGAFTRALHGGVQGAADSNRDLVVTIQELAEYVTTQVVSSTQNHQHPQWGNIEGRGTILLWDERRVPTEARTAKIPREVVVGFEDDLQKIHDLMDRQEYQPAERAVRNLGLRSANPEFNLLLAEIYVGQDALGNASLVETELQRVEGHAGLTDHQKQRVVQIRTAVERARRNKY